MRVLDLDDAARIRSAPGRCRHGMLARLIGELKTAGAAVVVLDHPLGAPDPLSPQAFAKALPPGPKSDVARGALMAMPSPDTALATALGSLHVGDGADPGSRKAPATGLDSKSAIAVDGAKETLIHVPQFRAVTGPLAPDLPRPVRARRAQSASKMPMARCGRCRCCLRWAAALCRRSMAR